MSGTHGVFQHRSGYFYTILEEDFCEVFKAPGVNEVCRAYITSILEHLTNKQFEATGSEKELWVFMSLPEMARRMRHACSERTIHKELQGMVKDGFIEKRRAVGKATMEYKLNLKRIRKALEALPDGQSCKSATYNLADLQEPSSNSARSTLQNYKNDLANLQARIPIDIPIEETKITEEGIATSAEDRPAPISLEVEKKKRETDPRHPAINLKGQEAHGTSHSDSGISDAGRDTASSADRESAGTAGHARLEQKPGASPLPSAVSRAGDGGHGDASAQASSQQTISTEGLPAPAATDTPLPPVIGVQQGAMAMTPRQIKAQAERREKELWSIIEAERHTKYTSRQREMYENKEGMKCLIADDISDEELREGLQALDAFQRKSFTVLKFYGWLPNLYAKAPILLKRASNGHHSDMVEWQGQLMTIEQADENGYNGGFGAYK